MNCEEIYEFQVAQKEIVAMIGAFLMPLKSFSESLSEIGGELSDLSSVRQLQPIVSAFVSKAGEINQFCNKYHYPTYYKEIIRPASRITTLLGNQTLPSKKLEVDEFRAQLDAHIELISEVMIATAQIVTPSVDINVKAGNPFTAYCFISSLMDSTTSSLIVVDPYIDQSIFYRYLYRLLPEINIKIATDKGKLTGERLRSFESVETLFAAEYPNYERKLFSDLHDRYLINETNAYSLGGSIKDAAKKSDFSIMQVTEDKRNELLQTYA